MYTCNYTYCRETVYLLFYAVPKSEEPVHCCELFVSYCTSSELNVALFFFFLSLSTMFLAQSLFSALIAIISDDFQWQFWNSLCPCSQPSFLPCPILSVVLMQLCKDTKKLVQVTGFQFKIAMKK